MAENPRVLIIDDDKQFCRSLVKLLTNRKIDASAVSESDKAMDVLAASVYDVILLDIRMPGISGIDLLKQIKARGVEAEVIILSGHASVGTAMEAVRYGAYDYLMKPCDIEELLVKISLAYDRRVERRNTRQPLS